MKLMKKTKIIAFILCLSIVLSIIPASNVKAESWMSYLTIEQISKKNVTTSFPVKGGGFSRLRISGFKKRTYIDWKSVKSSNKKVLEIGSVDSYSSKEGYICDILFYVHSKGTSKVTFKINKKKYSVNIKVVDHFNPVKYYSIKGYKKGKKLKPKYNPSSSMGLDIKNVNIKNAVLHIETKKGWEVNKIFIQSFSQGVPYISQEREFTVDGVKKTNKITSIEIGNISKDIDYGIGIEFINKNGSTDEQYININKKENSF